MGRPYRAGKPGTAYLGLRNLRSLRPRLVLSGPLGLQKTAAKRVVPSYSGTQPGLKNRGMKSASGQGCRPIESPVFIVIVIESSAAFPSPGPLRKASITGAASLITITRFEWPSHSDAPRDEVGLSLLRAGAAAGHSLLPSATLAGGPAVERPISVDPSPATRQG